MTAPAKTATNQLIGKTSRGKGMTLVETVICLVLVMIAALATFAAITYTRLNLELEKQRMAAVNYCRQAMEAIQSLDTAEAGEKRLVPFNSPGIEDLEAKLVVEYFELNDGGTVNFSAPRTEPLIGKPVYARASVSWTPYGSMTRSQKVSMATIVTRGID